MIEQLWRCNVILMRDYSPEEVHSDEFREIATSWAKTHRVTKIECLPTMSNAICATSWTYKLHNAVVPGHEIRSDGSVFIGAHQAYVGGMELLMEGEKECTMHPAATPAAGPVGSSVGHILEEILLGENVPTAEREVYMNMTLRDFLGFVKQVAEGQPVQKTNGTQEQPHMWGVSKKTLLSGVRVKCPQCKSGPLQMVEGQVKCPLCGLDLGDIDDMEDLV